MPVEYLTLVLAVLMLIQEIRMRAARDRIKFLEKAADVTVRWIEHHDKKASNQDTERT